PCCSGKSEQAKTPTKGQTKAKCPHCCGADDSAPQPRPSKPPARPQKSMPSCCCDQLPAAPRNVQQKSPLPVATLSATVAIAPPLQAAVPRWTDPEAFVIAVDLHLLHCLWLC